MDDSEENLSSPGLKAPKNGVFDRGYSQCGAILVPRALPWAILPAGLQPAKSPRPPQHGRDKRQAEVEVQVEERNLTTGKGKGRGRGKANGISNLELNGKPKTLDSRFHGNDSMGDRSKREILKRVQDDGIKEDWIPVPA